MDRPQQLSFASLAFPKDRTVLTVAEVAERWKVSDRHVVDLIEEGKLLAFEISGRRDYTRVPFAAIEEISRITGMPVSRIQEIIRSSKPTVRRSPAFYRIPVESYDGFIRENHSLALGGK